MSNQKTLTSFTLMAVAFAFVFFLRLPMVFSSEPWQKKVQAALDRQDYVKALDLLSVVIKENPNDPVPYVARAYLYTVISASSPTERNAQKAVADYTEAIRLNPHRTHLSSWYNNRGAGYLILKEYDQALADINLSLGLNPQNSEAYANRGLVFYWKGAFERALSDLDRAIELNPRGAMAYQNRTLVLLQLKKHQRALDDATKAVELNPKHSGAYANRGLVLYWKGDFERAHSDLDRAIELNPRDGAAFQNRSLVLVKLKKHQRALDDAKKAVELSPNLGTLYLLGKQYLRNGDPKLRDVKMALKFAQEAQKASATSLESNNPLFLVLLAAAQAHDGNFIEAIRFQTMAVDLCAKEEEKVAAQKVLRSYQEQKLPVEDPWKIHEAIRGP